MLIISVHYIPFIPIRQSQNDELFVNWFTPLNAAFVLTVAMVPNFGIHYMYPTDVKGIKHVSRFRQNINNSMLDDYNAITNS